MAIPINITNPLPDTSADAVGKPAAAVALHKNSPFAPGSFGDGDVFNWLNAEIDNWNTAHATSYPDAVSGAGGAALLQSTGSDPDGVGGYPGFPANTSSIQLPLGDYDYVVFHWGGQGGGWIQAYYLGDDISGTATFNAPPENDNNEVGGLSFYRLFGPTPTGVPDAGPTLGLLSLGLLGLEALRRRFGR
jgi:hypothetical protein